MALANKRLKVISRRLIEHGAQPLIPLADIDRLKPDEAENYARAEADRLAGLVAMEAEQYHPRTRKSSDLTPRQLADEMEREAHRRS